MPENTTIVEALRRNWEMVSAAVAEVDEDTLNTRPNPDSNSMSWLIWHMTRVTDRFIHYRIAGTPQIWTVESWYGKFCMPEDPQEYGLGWTNEQAAQWQASSKAVLMEYFDRVNTDAAQYLSAMTDADLERVIPFPAPPDTLTVKEALGNLIWDNIAHGGQVAYLRGFFRGSGWHR
ncbi:MAG: DinB family protein [SAR202 cluster bacterium]|nr:DinB family protein [SAR202 cluster bacterium]